MRRCARRCRGSAGFALEVFDDHARLLERFAADPPDLVLNFCDTGFRNVATQELHVPALLELLGVPYSGATPACMAICYDKQIVRLVAEALGIPVPREIYLAPAQSLEAAELLLPALIKPNQADGSVGITKDAVVRTPAEAERYLAWLQHELPGRAVLVQEYLPGPEYGVGLIGNPGDELVALPALEVDYARLPAGLAPILSFESKAMPGFALLDRDQVQAGRGRTGAADDDGGPGEAAVRAARLPRLRPLRLPRRRRRRAEAAWRSIPIPPGPTTASSRSWRASPASTIPACSR